MYNSYGVSPTILDSSPKFAASGIWTIVSVILAIIGGIVNAPSWIQFTVGIFSKVG